jgi:hypothetical protein
MSRSPYSLHPGFAREDAFEANLPQRTGRDLAQWLALIRADGPPTEAARRDWLMKSHGMGLNYAWWLAERAEGKGGVDDYHPGAFVEAMFAGGKAALRPVYDELLALALALGDDVKACPCQTIVPLYRRHVFAQLKPATRTRLDLGLALRDSPFSARLIDTGGHAKGDRLTHRIALASVGEIDAEVRHWLKVAYNLDATDAPVKKRPAGPLEVPDDLARALAAVAGARAAFDKLPPSHRRDYVENIEEAKKPETRQRRIAKAVERVMKGRQR